MFLQRSASYSFSEKHLEESFKVRWIVGLFFASIRQQQRRREKRQPANDQKRGEKRQSSTVCLIDSFNEEN